MSNVIVLIGRPHEGSLARELVTEVTERVRGEASWLAPDEAAEIAFEHERDGIRADLGRMLEGQSIDWAVLGRRNRRKRLLLADMDSTIITIECIDELADYAGIKAEVARVTQRAMNGELDFATALRERVALLAGLSTTVIDEVIRERLRFTDGARTLVATMKRHGASSALVSGGFTAFTSFVAEALGFDHHDANVLEVVAGRLSGRLVEPLRDAHAKRRTLVALAEAGALSTDDAIAVGDGANDLPMLTLAGYGVAYRAHTRVREATRLHVGLGDLTALLFLQGYARSEFAS